MSKNLTRKGLAFGAIVALGSSLFVGAPANADNNGPITLLPDGGTIAAATNNSIIGAGLTMTGTLNPATQGATTGVSATLEGPVAKAVYIVTNPSGAKITIDTDNGTANPGFLVYNSDGDTSANGTTASQTYATTTLGTVDTVALYVVYDSTAKSYVTNAKKIVVGAGVKGTANSGQSDDVFSTIHIDAAGTSTVSLTVQAVTDTDAAAAGTTGKVGSFENASAVETVTLYPISAVTASTTIETLARGAAAVTGKVVYGSSINPFAVDANTTATLFKDGVAYDLDVNSTPAGANVTKLPATTAVAATGKLAFAGWSDDDAATPAAVNFASGVYSLQTYFKATGGNTYVAVGAASPVANLSNGLIAGVTSVDAVVTETSNLDESSDTVTARTGTETVVVSVSANAIEKAGIRFKATVTATNLDADSTAVVSGTTSTLAETDDVVVAYATSTSTGKASFTLTNAGAAEDDKLTVVVTALDVNGEWVGADTVTITWADAALTSFSAVPGNYVSGANPTLTFKAKDQFGAPVSATATGALSVNVVAKIGGIEKKALLSETGTVVNGEVSFTFANFATAAIPGQVQATLFEGVTKSSVSAPAGTASGVITVNVYNSTDTATITVLDAYATTITYKDFVVGDESEAAVAAAVALSGIGGVSGADISGSVQNATAVGQPGAVVTVAADGVLFYDSVQGIYAEDSIVIYTNEYGAYSVEAIAHMVNTTGHAVTVTSGGKTVSTLLKAYFPKDELTAANLAFSWDMPAELVVNTTYALTVRLTDKWGNPVATPGANSVAVEGNGSVLVNGVTGATSKKFDKNGEAVVFVRSLKDIAGPGAVSATLSAAASQYAIDPAITADSAGFDRFGSLVALTTDVTSTAWNETAFASVLEVVVDVKEAATPVASDQKVNAGSFKGYVALYAKGYEGQRMSAKVGKDWVVVPALASDFERVVEFTGAGVD
ncbi:MAG: hypothetical protein P8M68_06545, partial [Aquiluna sp.]|nr:hypothetical protein [Aquiluna sp.]